MTLRSENLTLRWICSLIILSIIFCMSMPVHSFELRIHKWDNNFIQTPKDETETRNTDESDEPRRSYGAECLNTAANSGDQMTCCLQYTWPGHTFNPHLSTTDTPRNCTEIKLNALCEGPIVYAANTTRRPDPQRVGEFCDANGHNCFCIGNACMIYVIYENTDGNLRRSEVHSCVPVRLQNDGSIIKDGCYQQSKNGSLHEVCVCKGSFCNDSTVVLISGWTLVFTIVVSSLNWMASAL